MVQISAQKPDLYLEGAWFKSRHKNPTCIWKMHGSNLGTKTRLVFGRCMVQISAQKPDLYLEGAWFKSRHEMRPSCNSLTSYSVLPRQCNHVILQRASATPFCFLSDSLFNIILSLTTLTEGVHLLSTNIVQPLLNCRRQKGDTRQSGVQ